MIMNDKSKILAAIHAILFASGDAVEIKKISQTLDLSLKETLECINCLKEKFDLPESGIRLIKLSDKIQLCTKEEFSDIIKKILYLKKNTPLSPAAMEVLSIIAYNEPVTKSFIEQIRGVDSSYLVTSLCNKELVEERGRLELPGRPIVYGTTTNFLRCFSLESLKDLPPLPNTNINSK